MPKGTILLAAGGTGGHLFPAEALAHELVERGWRVDLATDDRVERFSGTFPATNIHRIPSATMGGRNPFKLIGSMLKIWRGVRQASDVIRVIKAEAVVGFGGYPTLPPLFAATRRRVPSVIHEQNVVMGRANKALAARVTAIAGGFLGQNASGFPDKFVTTGNPARQAVIDAAQAPYPASKGDEPFQLLVFGGSQGASYFSDAVPAAVALLPEELRKRLQITQQARAEDVGRVKDAYAALDVPHEVLPFFDTMAKRMAAANLIISRAGASTVTEISVIGRPAILVPYPHALDHDQSANAAALASAGGGEVRHQKDLSPELLAERLTALMTDPDRLATMAAAAKSTGRPDAARLLADLTEAIAAGRTVSEFREGLAR